MKNGKIKKSALGISALLFIVWWILGTSATLAWFTDTPDPIRNEFRIGDLALDVSFKNDVVTDWTPLEGATIAFNDEALYEPGYTQVVYLKLENNGNVDFNYKMSVTVENVQKAKSVLGNDIYLPNYLKYGAVFAESEIELDRKLARGLAEDYMLDTWSEVSEYTFEVGEEPHYAALIVYMPEAVGDEANYRGIAVPQVELGITVSAQQADAPLE